jgi:nucleoside-specific outer membrane channel protein Tsx
MKKQMTKILLGGSLLVSGQVMSQTDFIEKEPINISSIYHNNLLENFRVRIYPNPSFIATVKMEWQDWAEITKVVLYNTNTNQSRIVEVEEGLRKISVSGLEEGTYIVKFYQKNTLFGNRKIKVID